MFFLKMRWHYCKAVLRFAIEMPFSTALFDDINFALALFE